MHRVLSFICALSLSACAVAPPMGMFHRISDGQRVDANPQILAKFQRDRILCDGEAAKAALTSNENSVEIHRNNLNLIFDACLAEKGYLRK